MVGRRKRSCEWGHWNTLAGQPTYDSEMALVLARCLVRERRFDTSIVGQAYVVWGAAGPFAGYHLDQNLHHPSGHDQSQANGAIMRVSPIGIFAAGQPALAAQLARADAALTHPHPICGATSPRQQSHLELPVPVQPKCGLWHMPTSGATKAPQLFAAGSTPI